MKRQRKTLVNGGHFVLDANGNKVPVDPQKDIEIATACAAVIKTLETGKLHIPATA